MSDQNHLENHLLEISSVLQAQEDAEERNKELRDQSIAVLKNERSRLMGELTIERASSAQNKIEMKLMKSMISESAAQISDLEKNKSKLQLDLSESQQLRLVLESDLKDIKRDIIALNSVNAKLTLDVETSEAKIETMNVELVNEREISNAIKTNYISLKQSSEEIKLSYNALIELSGRQKIDISELQNSRQKDEQNNTVAIRAEKERNNVLQQKYNALESENKRLEDEAVSTEDTINNLTNQMQEAENEKTALAENIELLKTRNDIFQHEIELRKSWFWLFKSRTQSDLATKLYEIDSQLEAMQNNKFPSKEKRKPPRGHSKKKKVYPSVHD